VKYYLINQINDEFIYFKNPKKLCLWLWGKDLKKYSMLILGKTKHYTKILKDLNNSNVEELQNFIEELIIE
jgi:hypothetical protein